MSTLHIVPGLIVGGIHGPQAQRPAERRRMEIEFDTSTGDLKTAEPLFGHPINFHADFNDQDLNDLDRLSILVDTRDDASGKHALRVGTLSREFAMHLGLPRGAAHAIELAARLHDIGKVFIPDRILLKPGPLDESERGTMEQHTNIGAQLLNGGVSHGRLLARLIARFHHECWDGNGYPMGLPGEQIPYVVRLVTVVDVFDALVNERPYKRAWDGETTFTWMLRQAGRQFDPVLVKEFVDFLKPHRGEIPTLLRQLEVPGWTTGN